MTKCVIFNIFILSTAFEQEGSARGNELQQEERFAAAVLAHQVPTAGIAGRRCAGEDVR